MDKGLQITGNPEDRPLNDQISWLKEQLIHKLLDEAPVSDEEVYALTDAMEMRVCEAGEVLLQAGEVLTHGYLTLKGCVRQYYLVDGEEKTTYFYTEGYSISSYLSAAHRKPAKYYLGCVEDTILADLSAKKQNELFKKYPSLESSCRVGLEEEVGHYQQMLATYITTSPEERYLDLLKNRPELLNRVPQYQLASYIGVKPESLSRIRKRIMAHQ